MATVTQRSGVSSATDNAAVVSASFTPTAGDLLVVFAMHTGKTTIPAVTASANGITFSSISGISPTLKNASADSQSVWIADQLVPASPVAMTCTTTPTTSTAGFIFVFSVTGMVRTGTSAVRSRGNGPNGAAITPNITLTQATLTGNPLLGSLFNGTNPATMTPPTGWTETATIGDIGTTPPASGGEVAFLAAGAAVSSVSWGSASGSAQCGVVVEMDTSALPVFPDRIRQPAGAGNSRGQAVHRAAIQRARA